MNEELNTNELKTSRDEAKAAGHRFYIGKICEYKHAPGKRYASNGKCAECRRMYKAGEAPAGGWQKKRPRGEPVTLAFLFENSAENAETGCLEWQRATLPKGYGHVWHEGRWNYAHRLAFELSGKTLPSGHHVLHRCDNPKCLRPDHLFAGTNRDNVLDKVQKGRCPRGESHSNALFTEQQVPEVDALLAAGMPQRAIAAKFGVSQMAISNIATRRTWKHVQPATDNEAA